MGKWLEEEGDGARSPTMPAPARRRSIEGILRPPGTDPSPLEEDESSPFRAVLMAKTGFVGGVVIPGGVASPGGVTEKGGESVLTGGIGGESPVEGGVAIGYEA